MNIQIESITPEFHEGHGLFRFKVTIKVDDDSTRSFHIDPGPLLDFQQFRAEVASNTGYLLNAEMAASWEAYLERLWERPESRVH